MDTARVRIVSKQPLLHVASGEISGTHPEANIVCVVEWDLAFGKDVCGKLPTPRHSSWPQVYLPSRVKISESPGQDRSRIMVRKRQVAEKDFGLLMC